MVQWGVQGILYLYGTARSDPSSVALNPWALELIQVPCFYPHLEFPSRRAAQDDVMDTIHIHVNGWTIGDHFLAAG